MPQNCATRTARFRIASLKTFFKVRVYLDIHEVCDNDGKMAYQRQRRGQRLAHREAVGKVETEFEPWRGDT